MNLRQLAEHAMNRAKEISAKGAQVNAAFLCLNPVDETLVIIGMPQYAEYKGEAIATMKAALEMYRADRYAFVCEAWMAMPKTPEERAAISKPGYAPSRDPKRISAIVVVAKSKGGEQISMMCEIKSHGHRNTFKDIDTSGDMQMMGVLDNLYGELGKPS